MLLCMTQNSLGQDFPSREEIKMMRMFIDAEKERIIGNYQESVRLFEACLDIDEKNDAAYFGIGKVYLEEARYTEAQEAFGKAYALDKENKWYALSLGQMLLEQLKFKEASGIYKKVSEANPDDQELKLDYANTLLYAGKEKAAMKVFEEIEAVTGPTHEIARRKYDYLITAQKYDEAAEVLRKLLQVYPDDQQLYGMLAELYKAQGKVQEAISIYEAAFRSDPDNPIYQLALAEFYDRDGRADTAFAYLLRAFNNPNLDIDRKVGVLLRIYNEAERDPETLRQALELCDAVVETHPEEAKSYSVQGDFLNLDNRREQALESFRKAVEIDPSRFAIWSQIMLIDSEYEQYDALLSDSKAAMALFPAQPTVYYFNGIANAQQERWKEAAKSLRIGAQMVIGNNALSAQLLANLGDVYHEMGRTVSSDSAYEAALEYDPYNAYVLNNYSYYLSLRGERLEQAKEMSMKTLVLDPENASYADTYGWILYQMGDYEEAETALARSLSLGADDSPEVLEHYGDVLYRLGRIEEALEFWTKSKDAGGESKALISKLTTKKLDD